MKYGETLRQRSVPQWAYQNVDYDAIKWLIKEQTTPGKAKAMSVPGQGSETELLFESELYHHLVEQHDKIGLFVKSKSSEIQRRLDHLDHHLHNLQIASWPPSRLTSTIPPSRIAKYARIEEKTIETGQVIKHLSRFIAAQRLAFVKLLKKYKKWTRRSSLGENFTEQVLSRPDSFTRFDLKPHLEHWTDLLQGIRVAMGVGQGRESAVPSPSIQPMVPQESSALVARKLQDALKSGVEVDFDLMFSYASPGSGGQKAVYWVHPEQLVELQVLLLQHTRLAFAKASPRPSSATTRPRTSSLARRESYIDKSPEHGVVVIDNADELAQRANGVTVGDSEDSSFLALPSASIAWTSSDDAAVWVREKHLLNQKDALTTVPRLRKKRVGTFLDVDKPFPQRQAGSETPDSVNGAPSSGEGIESARRWLKTHSYTKLLVGYFSHRSRFAALASQSDRGLWCTLDMDISMKPVSLADFEDKDWPQKIGGNAIAFPYAVLEIRQEGTTDVDLIKILDESHLTERIRGFSMAVHALWACRRPRSMTPPFWLPVLSVDIRKLPNSNAARRNRGSSIRSANGGGSAPSILSAADDTSGATTATLVGSIDFQPQVPPSALRTGASRARKARAAAAAVAAAAIANTEAPQTGGTRYWSEYDHPEEEEEDENGGYYIYVTPGEEEESLVPFKNTLKAVYKAVKRLFRGQKDRPSRKASESEPLLSNFAGVLPKATLSEDDLRSHTGSGASSTSSSDDDDDGEHHASLRSQYGTFLRHNDQHHPQSSEADDVITLTLFSSISLFFSTTTSLVLLVLSAVGKSKAREEVDIVVSLGVFVSLAFALAGFWGLARQGAGWARAAVGSVVLVGVLVVDGVLMGRMVSDLRRGKL